MNIVSQLLLALNRSTGEPDAATFFRQHRRSFFQYCVNSRGHCRYALTEEHLYRDQCVDALGVARLL